MDFIIIAARLGTRLIYDITLMLYRFLFVNLRSILNVRWQSVMSNKTLYERFNTRPLSERVAHAKWKMLGHVLRSTENSPSQSALCCVVDNDNMKTLPERRGRHRVNLLKVIRDDLLMRGISLSCYEDILLIGLNGGNFFLIFSGLSN